jgi:deazaflavin-dependent oxidoreductase (nitroreductase family)
MDRLRPTTIRLIGRLHAWLWKLTGGKLGNVFGRAPFMMLTTRGRKTGRERTTPVLYFQHGADLIVVASFGGNDIHPAWYLNLGHCPEAEVIINGERRRLLAYRVSPEEKEIIWPRLVKMYPGFAIYQQRTRREIQLLRLSDPRTNPVTAYSN